MEDEDDEAIMAYIEYMIEQGALVLDGITEDGEPLYKVDFDVAEIIAPEFAKATLQDTEDVLIDLFNDGLVDIEISDEGEVKYSASQKLREME